jgi:hypothetical protein
MAATLLLDRTLWDLCLDANGNIAVATDPYSVQQDVASACRTFLGECYYNTTIGVPYFQQILGRFPPIGLVKQLLADAAATVPGCTNPVVFISSVAGRTVTGQVQFTDSNGTTQVASF